SDPGPGRALPLPQRRRVLRPHRLPRGLLPRTGPGGLLPLRPADRPRAGERAGPADHGGGEERTRPAGGTLRARRAHEDPAHRPRPAAQRGRADRGGEPRGGGPHARGALPLPDGPLARLVPAPLVRARPGAGRPAAAELPVPRPRLPGGRAVARRPGVAAPLRHVLTEPGADRDVPGPAPRGGCVPRAVPAHPGPVGAPRVDGPGSAFRAQAAHDAATRYPAGVDSAADTLDLPGMAETDAPAQPEERDPDHPHPGQWRLVAVQVSNWGTFHGTHDLAISSKGYFLTGGPGTGKSTLLDAISALLTPPRTLQFNAAASDAGPNRSKYRRTVASYVRGAWAMHYDQATGEFSQEVLREKTTLSVLTLRYSDGQGGTVQLSRLLLLHAGHSADSDVKSLYVIARTPLDVTDLRQFVSTQIEGKALEAAHPGTQTFRQFREYRAAFCQLLGIPDEKALGLLHKIQSAKELGDVNALLRDYMLDAPRTFDLADQALANFQNLSEVY